MYRYLCSNYTKRLSIRILHSLIPKLITLQGLGLSHVWVLNSSLVTTIYVVTKCLDGFVIYGLVALEILIYSQE